MSSTTDMSTPVTRGELRKELGRFANELGKVFATKTELEMWGGALLARIESGEKRLTERLIGHMEQMEQRLRVDLGSHAKAHHEAMTMQISAMDDKYTDLPGRVGRLEAKVFPRARRR
jgi:hypothetical protein